MPEGIEAAGVELPAWPSVNDVEAEEEGGPVACKGFNYQDEIAVGFLLEMLKDPTLLKVHCGIACRRSDPQHLADRLDPEGPAMIIDERDHGFDRRSGSAIAK